MCIGVPLLPILGFSSSTPRVPPSQLYTQSSTNMPKYARDSDIDLGGTYGRLLDKHSPMQRNIRTKTWMNSAHHCEDPECGGGAPKVNCILRLHFAFCLAPVVDEDPDSPTCGDVVIHGERFAVISPSGCAEHPYSADFRPRS